MGLRLKTTYAYMEEVFINFSEKLNFAFLKMTYQLLGEAISTSIQTLKITYFLPQN